MKVVNKTLLVVEKEDKVAELHVSNDMPLGVLFDCLMEMRNYVVERMKDVVEKEKKQEPKECPQEECKEVE